VKNVTEKDWTNKTANDMVREFHLAFGHPVATEPGFPEDKGLMLLREKLVEEEFREVMDACYKGDLENLAKELADLIYVIHGMALVYGLPLDAVFDEVHRSNMSKLGADGRPVYRDDGKVLKGENYTPPDIGAIIYGKNRTDSRED